jgi:hypothetical protein
MSSNAWRWLKWVRNRRRAVERPSAREPVARRRRWWWRPLVEEVEDRTLLSAMPSLEPGGVLDVMSESDCATRVPSPPWRLTATGARGG